MRGRQPAQQRLHAVHSGVCHGAGCDASEDGGVAEVVARRDGRASSLGLFLTPIPEFTSVADRSGVCARGAEGEGESDRQAIRRNKLAYEAAVLACLLYTGVGATRTYTATFLLAAASAAAARCSAADARASASAALRLSLQRGMQWHTQRARNAGGRGRGIGTRNAHNPARAMPRMHSRTSVARSRLHRAAVAAFAHASSGLGVRCPGSTRVCKIPHGGTEISQRAQCKSNNTRHRHSHTRIAIMALTFQPASASARPAPPASPH